MATFYHGGSEIQAEGLQTLYLMNPGYVGYPDGHGGPTAAAAGATNMVFLNSAGNPLNPGNLGHAHHHHHQNPHFVGIPLPATGHAGSVPTWQDHNIRQQPAAAAAPQEISPVHGFISRLHWGSVDPSAASAAAHHAIQSPTAADVASHLGVRRAPPSVQQGLSLSLSPQQPAFAGYRSESEIQAAPPAISPGSGEDVRISRSTSSNSGVSNGITGIQSVLMGSKYLKAAQQLLDEVVNVGKGIRDEKAMKSNMKGQAKANKEVAAPENSGGETSTRRNVELTTAERQELQMKKAKLVSMLDEVEQRYRQYHHQMQLVVTSFEAAAGLGSAKTYTALALQTISKQFRCLRDAITGQIRATSKSLGEEESCYGGGKMGEGGSSSRLKFVDAHLRQQRALQQLGMIQHNAWRPQRGLPERSVSVLRAWLFEHFLHPYPKDSDKLMLAKQTGLTRSQVSNWFINARVRLWKPMVEEMYLEETKEQEQMNGGWDEKGGGGSKSEVNEEVSAASKSTSTAQDHNMSPTTVSRAQDADAADAPPPASINHQSSSCFPLNMATTSSEADMGISNTNIMFQDKEGGMMQQGHSKKPCRNTTNEFQIMMGEEDHQVVDLKPDQVSDDDDDDHHHHHHHELMTEERQPSRNGGYSLITSGGATTTHGSGAFGGGYHHLGDMGGRFDPEQFAPRFPAGNGAVSLTLGLPHCTDNLSTFSGTHHSFLSNQSMQMGRRLEMGGNEANDFCTINTTPTPTHSSNAAYDTLSLQSRKRFAAQLLPDFVA
ncbi:hypothetical protein H6P81_015769 [Aristolochia fimbriata]|uniref:Homeobox domain-containing protein n=1 Tax=Aristolochia fimbriata TaxID=158543 RepID=A0AAV7E890_ARIFI|nr:hypothetical protein H6P81_015769 [Aristolochia fimbriata]